MNKLKDLRAQFDLTQRQVAERLQTTQQTIQRWESGHTEIPAGHLKDLSVLFGCSIDELLGVDAKTKRREGGFARARHDAPWGTLKIGFGFGEREYPIDEHEYEALVEEFHSAIELKSPSGWVEFTTLDNRLVFLNPAFISEVATTTDDEEEMPFFAPPAAYKTLTTHLPLSGQGDPLAEVGPLLRDECTKLLTHLNLGDGPDEPDFDRAHEELNTLAVVRGDGKHFSTYLSDDVATSIFILESQLEIEPNAFLTVSAEGGNYRCVNLAAVAAIEVPVEAYLARIADADTN